MKVEERILDSSEYGATRWACDFLNILSLTILSIRVLTIHIFSILFLFELLEAHIHLVQDSHIEILGIELPKDELEVELLSLLIEQHHGREMVVSIESLKLELQKTKFD